MNNKQIMEDALELITGAAIHNKLFIISELRKAIEEYDKQEPVAWMYVNYDGECEEIGHAKQHYDGKDMPNFAPLYTRPQKEPNETRWTPAFIIPEREGKFYGVSSLGLVDICRYTNGEWHKMSDGTYCQFYNPSYVQKKELSDDDIIIEALASDIVYDLEGVLCSPIREACSMETELLKFARSVLKAARND